MSTINMQTMRYINLLDKTSHVKTRKCFVYNNIIFFAVPREFVSKAIGHDALNVKKIQERLGKKIKIIKEAESVGDANEFIESVVSPVKFKSVETNSTDLILTSGNNQSRAILIGRNKKRLEELKQIVQDIFGLNLRIV